MKTSSSLRSLLAGCLIALGLSSSASAELIYGIAAVGNATNLLSWDSATPANLFAPQFVTGLQNNETIVGIDFRPATNQLYALGSSSRLYTLNTATAAATPVGGVNNQFSTLLSGFSFGFDFNPNIDRIRVVSDADQNLVLDPDTGAVQTVATPLAYATTPPFPNVVHSAYDFGNPTQLYGIDTGLDTLVQQANNAGTLTTVGIGLGGNFSAAGGFDISRLTGIAYAALQRSTESQSSLHTIDLTTGLATEIGQIDGGLVITAMAVNAIPEPATAALAAAGLLAGVLVRRRNG